jgi:hypothetical protein
LNETDMTWEQLRVIRRYTINFNPAVEHQLRLERTRPRQRTARSSNDGTRTPTPAGSDVPAPEATAG